MTPQEKAISLVKSMSISDDTYLNRNRYAKQCALVAVDEVMNNIEPSISEDVASAIFKYWEQVKNEIEKL